MHPQMMEDHLWPLSVLVIFQEYLLFVFRLKPPILHSITNKPCKQKVLGIVRAVFSKLGTFPKSCSQIHVTCYKSCWFHCLVFEHDFQLVDSWRLLQPVSRRAQRTGCCIVKCNCDSAFAESNTHFISSTSFWLSRNAVQHWSKGTLPI